MDNPKVLAKAREAAAKTSAKTVHEVIARYIEFAGVITNTVDQGNALAARVRKATAHTVVGGCKIQIPRTEYTLIISPVPAPIDHKLDLVIPPMGDEEFHNENKEKMAREILHQIAMVRQMVIAYWIDFQRAKPKLWRDIDNYLGYHIDIVATEASWCSLFIEVNKDPAKLLKAPNTTVGIDHYYISKNGEILSTRLAKK